MYQAPTQWEQCGRTDLNIIPKMIAKGFTPEFSHKDKRYNRTTPENCPHDAVSFVKGNLHVWKIYGYKNEEMGYEWMSSELIDGYYTNHKPLQNIEEIFEINLEIK